MGAPIVLGAVEVQATALPRPEATSGVPVGRPIPVGLAAGPVEASSTGEGALAARPHEPGSGVPTTVVPALVVAGPAALGPRLAAGVVRLGATLALEAKADAGALRRPREPIRKAAATAGVPTTAMAPTRVPRVRGVAPTAGVAVPPTSSSVAAAATATG